LTLHRFVHSGTIVFALLLTIVLLQTQPAEAVGSRGFRSWVDVEVWYFDGESITARIMLRAAGNHSNATVRVWGEVFGSRGEPREPCIAIVCIRESVSGAIGRGIGEVVFSSDINMTTFQYTARFVSTYGAAMFAGVPVFPLDEHHLSFDITTDFNADIDQHVKRPRLPNTNYEGAYNVTRLPGQNTEYKYKLDLRIWHPGPFQWSMFLWTWGVTILLLALTFLMWGLKFRPDTRPERTNNIVTVSSAVTFFVPVFELSLQSFKSPLGIALSDFVLAITMILNVLLLIVILGKHFARSRGAGPPKTQYE